MYIIFVFANMPQWQDFQMFATFEIFFLFVSYLKHDYFGFYMPLNMSAEWKSCNSYFFSCNNTFFFSVVIRPITSLDKIPCSALVSGEKIFSWRVTVTTVADIRYFRRFQTDSSFIKKSFITNAFWFDFIFHLFLSKISYTVHSTIKHGVFWLMLHLGYR